MNSENGLTEDEDEVMGFLIAAYAWYMDLPVEHPQEQQEFEAAIHRLQDLLAVRVCRRVYPQGWARFVDGVEAS